MAAFIFKNGPVSAGIGSDVFGLREKGCEATGSCFINASACATVNSIDHSITVVGYGTDPVKGDYWMCVLRSEPPPRGASAKPPTAPSPVPPLPPPRPPPPAHTHTRRPFMRSIKNSWSEKFANDGFINVQRGVQCAGMCGDPSICGNVFGHGDPKGYYE